MQTLTDASALDAVYETAACSLNMGAVPEDQRAAVRAGLRLLDDYRPVPLFSSLTSYALGYYHGRARGCSECPESFDDTEAWHYKLGYDAGVADYCREEGV